MITADFLTDCLLDELDARTPTEDEANLIEHLRTGDMLTAGKWLKFRRWYEEWQRENR